MADAPFPYRLVASDLDGTLLGPKKTISPANVQAVRELQRRGARFALASGRRHQNSIRYYRKLGLDGLMISYSGALVQDPNGGPPIHDAPLAPMLAQELVARGKAEGYSVIYYHRDHLYLDTHDRWTDLYEARAGEKAEFSPGGDLRTLQGADCLKIVWYGDPDRLKAERAYLEHAYAQRLVVLSTAPENLEFLDPQANKAVALAALARFYDIDQAATIAIGDGENDAPMLRWAGLGVAVSDGDDLAKQAAKLIGPDGPPEESFARAVAAIFERISQEAASYA